MEKQHKLTYLCSYGDLNTVKKFYEENPEINISGDGYAAFRCACAYGNLNIAKWLYEIKPIRMNINNDYPFRAACEHGFLDVAQWLYETNPQIQNWCKIIHVSFGDNVNVFKWYYEITNTINDDKLNEVLFQNICKRGHLNIAQWLLETKPTIDISANHECAFMNACENQNLHIAQWLFKIKPSINIYDLDKSAFRYAYVNNDEELLEWLENTHKWIKIYREPIMAHYNANNVFNKIPIDLIKNICEFL